MGDICRAHLTTRAGSDSNRSVNRFSPECQQVEYRFIVQLPQLGWDTLAGHTDVLDLSE